MEGLCWAEAMEVSSIGLGMRLGLGRLIALRWEDEENGCLNVVGWSGLVEERRWRGRFCRRSTFMTSSVIVRLYMYVHTCMYIAKDDVFHLAGGDDVSSRAPAEES